MGCSNSYEPKVQTVKQTVISNPSQNLTNQKEQNKSKPEDYNIDLKVPDEKEFELDPNFF